MIETTPLELDGVIHIKQRYFTDDRGSFAEIYRKPFYQDQGITEDFVQDNHSFSKKGTVRGMHFQSTPGQAKLISVIDGVIFDVYVDIRKDSPTFGKWGGRMLDSKEHEQIFIPVGFAHGFAVLSDSAHVVYKVSNLYNPETEKTFLYNDPEVGIEWPIDSLILSEKDKNAPTFVEVVS